jgi:glycosyltransferase involved in cell wall biosynthesis
MKILLVSHQLGYSGAPIALLQLATCLKSLAHDVSLISLKRGPLGKRFAELSITPHLMTETAPYDLVIANTILSIPLALKIATSEDRLFPWIHEARYFFDIIRVAPSEFHLDRLKYAGFPSRFLFDDYRDFIPNAKFIHFKNHVSLPRHIPHLSFRDYYVCTGQWEERKNQIALLNLLDQMDSRITIHFIGTNKPPWIKDTRHVFHGEVTCERSKALIANSNGLVSASLSEVQPLSVIEAMMAGIPVLLSDIPAHRELKEAIPDILLFNPCSFNSFLAGFNDLIIQYSKKQIRDSYRFKSEVEFGEEQFVTSVISILSMFNNR